MQYRRPRSWLVHSAVLGAASVLMGACSSGGNNSAKAAGDDLGAAQSVQISQNADNVSVSWQPQNQAEEYSVCLALEPIASVADCESLAGGRLIRTDQTSAVFLDTTPGATYFVSVTASNDLSSGPSFTTGNLPGETGPITVQTDSDSYTLSWEPVARASRYQVCIARDPVEDFSACELLNGGVMRNIDATTMQRAVEPGVAYYVRIAGVNDYGRGAPSAQVLAAAMGNVQNFAVAAYSSAAVVGWDRLVAATGYDVCVAEERIADYESCSSYQGGQLLNDVVPGTLVDSLLNGRRYYVRVIPWNDANYGPASEQLEVLPYGGNDSGVTQGGTYPLGSNTRCAGDVVAQQDCAFGRDSIDPLPRYGVGSAGFDWTKLDSDGIPLGLQNEAWHISGDASSGEQWSCVKDNVTGLYWEVKVDENDRAGDSGLGDADDRFGAGDHAVGEHCDVPGECSANAYALRANAQWICGYNDWRVPDVEELKSIVHYGRSPAQDEDIFPTMATQSLWTRDEANDNETWQVRASLGTAVRADPTSAAAVRLVRGAWR